MRRFLGQRSLPEVIEIGNYWIEVRPLLRLGLVMVGIGVIAVLLAVALPKFWSSGNGLPPSSQTEPYAIVIDRLHPPDAQLFLDGQPVQPDRDGTLRVGPGGHWLTAVKTGYRTARIAVTEPDRLHVFLYRETPRYFRLEHPQGGTIRRAWLTPDGQRVQYWVDDQAWEYDPQTDTARRLTPLDAVGESGVFSHDQQSIAYLAPGERPSVVVLKVLDVTHNTTRDLIAIDRDVSGRVNSVAWTPDGKAILVALGASPSENSRLIRIAVPTQPDEQPSWSVLVRAPIEIIGAPYQWDAAGERFTFVVFNQRFQLAMARLSQPEQYQLLSDLVFHEETVRPLANPSAWLPNRESVLYAAARRPIQSPFLLSPNEYWTLWRKDPSGLPYFATRVVPSGQETVETYNWQGVKVLPDGTVLAINGNVTAKTINVARLVTTNASYFDQVTVIASFPILPYPDFQVLFAEAGANFLIVNPQPRAVSGGAPRTEFWVVMLQ